MRRPIKFPRGAAGPSPRPPPANQLAARLHLCAGPESLIMARRSLARRHCACVARQSFGGGPLASRAPAAGRAHVARARGLIEFGQAQPDRGRHATGQRARGLGAAGVPRQISRRAPLSCLGAAGAPGSRRIQVGADRPTSRQAGEPPGRATKSGGAAPFLIDSRIGRAPGPRECADCVLPRSAPPAAWAQHNGAC